MIVFPFLNRNTTKEKFGPLKTIDLDILVCSSFARYPNYDKGWYVKSEIQLHGIYLPASRYISGLNAIPINHWSSTGFGCCESTVAIVRDLAIYIYSIIHIYWQYINGFWLQICIYIHPFHAQTWRCFQRKTLDAWTCCYQDYLQLMGKHFT